MKSSRVSLIVLFSVFCIGLNAQVFIGGNFGFNISDDKTNDGGATINKSSNYSLSLSPKIGKFLSEKTAIGFALNISLSGNTAGVNPETISKSSSWEVVFFCVIMQ